MKRWQRRSPRLQGLAKRSFRRVSSITLNADSRPPVAIRITRPYASEDEYLEQELDTLTRTSITLIGAQPRPEGVVLRFEVVLPAGQVLLRGEGRVVGFKSNAYEGVGGLALRFTRLDMRSKTLVDRATALREKRRPSMQPLMSERPPGAGSMAPPPLSRRPPPPARETLQFPAPVLEAVSSSALESSPSMPLLEDPASSPALESPPLLPRPSIAPARTQPSGPPVSPRELGAEAAPPARSNSLPPAAPAPVRAPRPPDRDALLDRLRARARGLDPVVITSALGERGRR